MLELTASPRLRLRVLACHPGLALEGLDAAQTIAVPDAGRLTIGRRSDDDLRALPRDGIGLLGGRRSYVLERDASGAVLLRGTGHPGRVLVGGVHRTEPDIALIAGDVVDLVTVDGEPGLRFVVDKR